MLIDGLAVGFHGYPRATADLDVWIAVTPENATRAVDAIREFGFESFNLVPDLFLLGRKIVRMGHPPMRIEVMNKIDGVEFADCWQRRVDADFDGRPVPVIGLDDFRINKQASGRPKDLDDLEQLP